LRLVTAEKSSALLNFVILLAVEWCRLHQILNGSNVFLLEYFCDKRQWFFIRCAVWTLASIVLQDFRILLVPFLEPIVGLHQKALSGIRQWHLGKGIRNRKTTLFGPVVDFAKPRLVIMKHIPSEGAMLQVVLLAMCWDLENQVCARCRVSLANRNILASYRERKLGNWPRLSKRQHSETMYWDDYESSPNGHILLDDTGTKIHQAKTGMKSRMNHVVTCF
jgi:hypothetical protein